MRYQTLKNIIRKSTPKGFLYKNENFLRTIYAFFYSGKAQQCNICGKKLSRFPSNERNELICPKCGSIDRDRRLWQLLEKDFLTENCKILDFSPSRSLYRKLKNINTIDYKSTDLSGHFNADFQYDITNLEIEQHTFDLIICYHILEHVTADTKAMCEIFRVLKPGGKAIIQTPFKDGEIYENPIIISPEERLIHFGQEDHVRIYSKEGLKKRLESVGFKVEIKQFDTPDYFHGFCTDETLLIVTKP